MEEMFPSLSAGTGDAGLGSSPQAPGFTWTDLIKALSSSSGVSPTGINSQKQLPFTWPGMQQQNKNIPLYSQVQPVLDMDEQQKQSSVDNVAQYVKFFQALFA